VGIKRILAPTDFSEPSQRGVEQAVELAAQLGAEVHIVHVVPLLLYALGPDVVPDMPGFEEQLKQNLSKKLEAAASAVTGRGAEIRTLLIDGTPGQTIAEVAQQRGFDLVVMATHGRSGLSRIALGSVAERTVRTSQVPVLTVRVPG
jgi:nucleotide-binding universal stress UspA family protein